MLPIFLPAFTSKEVVIKSNLDSFYVSDDLELECSVVSGGGNIDEGTSVRWDRGEDGRTRKMGQNVVVEGNVLK